MAAVDPISSQMGCILVPSLPEDDLEKRVSELCDALSREVPPEEIETLKGRCSLDTALIESAKKGDSGAMKILLKAGAKPNARNGLEETPLHLVALSRNPDAVMALLEADADTNLTDYRSVTPLHRAAISGNPDIIKALLAAGANPILKDRFGKMPCDYAVGSCDLDTVKTLFKNIDMSSLPQERKDTLLRRAAEKGRGEVVKWLVEVGADPSRRGLYEAPLLIAIKSGNSEAVKVLLDMETAIPKYVEVGESLLDYAARSGSVDVINVILEAGLHKDLKYCSDVLVSAVESGSVAAIERLLEVGIPPNPIFDGPFPLHAAASSGDGKVVMALIRGRAILNSACRLGHTPLHKAMGASRDTGAIECLLKNGANPEALPGEIASPFGSLRGATPLGSLRNFYGPKFEKFKIYLDALPRAYETVLSDIYEVVKHMTEEERRNAIKVVADFIQKHSLSESPVFIENMGKLDPSFVEPLREAYKKNSNWNRRKGLLLWRNSVETKAKEGNPAQITAARVGVVRENKSEESAFWKCDFKIFSRYLYVS